MPLSSFESPQVRFFLLSFHNMPRCFILTTMYSRRHPLATTLKSLFFLLAFLACVPAEAQSRKRIIYIGHSPDKESLWTITRNGAVAAARRLDFHIQLRNPPTGSPGDFLDLVETAIASKPDGLVLAVPNPNYMEHALLRAQQADLPVIAIGTDIARESPIPLIAHIGENSWAAGLKAGEAMTKNKIRIVLCLNEQPLWYHYRSRCQGLADGLEGSVDMLNISSTNPEADIRNYIDSNPALQAIITMNPEILPTVEAILKQQKKTDKIALATFGFNKIAADMISEKKLLFAVDQQPFTQGYMAGLLMQLYLKQQALLPEGKLQTGPHILTRSNIARAKSHAGTFR